LIEMYDSSDELFAVARSETKKVFSLQFGDHILITGGADSRISGQTNLLKIETI